MEGTKGMIMGKFHLEGEAKTRKRLFCRRRHRQGVEGKGVHRSFSVRRWFLEVPRWRGYVGQVGRKMEKSFRVVKC